MTTSKLWRRFIIDNEEEPKKKCLEESRLDL